MAGFRFRAALVLALATLAQGTARAETKDKKPTFAVYSLAAVGDAAYGKWIADTIPQVIAPESWSNEGAKGDKPVITYHAPKKVLVVRHTPAVQAKVAAFIEQLKKAGSTGGEEESSVRPAKAVAPAPVAALAPREPVAGYPVPRPVKQPKHLVHFIIRYEGDGFIDSSVVKFAKVMTNGGRPYCERNHTPGSLEKTLSAPLPTPAYCPPPTPTVPNN